MNIFMLKALFRATDNDAVEKSQVVLSAKLYPSLLAEWPHISWIFEQKQSHFGTFTFLSKSNGCRSKVNLTKLIKLRLYPCFLQMMWFCRAFDLHCAMGQFTPECRRKMDNLSGLGLGLCPKWRISNTSEFMSDGRTEEETDQQIRGWATVLRGPMYW